MLRNIVLFLNLFILLIYQALVSNTVSINQKSPENVKAGEEFTVELTISKGTIAGFAKFQQDLPEGFTASSGDAKGGSFSFSEQKVKFIWMSLPADAEFKISYKVKVADNVSGEFSFNGVFSYLENNDKKNAEMPAKSIKVIPNASAPTANNTPPVNNNNDEEEEEDDDEDDSSVATTSAANNSTGITNTSTTSTTPPIAQNNNTENNDEDEDEDEEDNETPSKPAINNENSSQNTTIATGSVQCIRTINTANLASNREIIVNITINKGAVAGFAKLQETLPVGFTATNIEASQGVFSFVDQKAKFLWMSLPAESTIKVSYKITVAPGITGVYYLNGEFSYVENDETKKSIIERQEINLDASPALAQNNNQADMNSSNNIQAAINNNTSNNQQTSTNAGRQAATKVNNGGGNNVTNIPAPQTGINFRVQIAAGHTPVSASYFKTTKGIEDYVNVEDHEGWKKYTIGGYAQYKEARDKREYVKTTNGVNGPFVTAYNNGVRITVQEALMISNQRWVQ